MKSGFPDHLLINRTSLLVLTGRLLSVLLVLVLGAIGGFSPREVWRIVYVLGPLTALYFVAFGRFVILFPYTVEKRKLGKRAAGAAVLFPLLTAVFYFLVILTNGLFKIWFTFEELQGILFVGELLNAIFVATCLSYLFEIREKSGFQ